MSLSCPERRLLGTIDNAICRSDPHLASMLSVFGRLTAGDNMPGHEQLPIPAWTRFRAAVITAAVAVITAAVAVITAAVAVITAAGARPGRRDPDRQPEANSSG